MSDAGDEAHIDSPGIEDGEANSGAERRYADDHDIEFFWDPVCPFAWVTSRWVDRLVDLIGLRVDWRFISLRILNADKDYADFPPGYEEGHNRGRAMLRVAAATREAHGSRHMGPLYTAFGESIWNRQPAGAERHEILASIAQPAAIEPILERLGLPGELALAADDPGWDSVLEAETKEALRRTGENLGTPIISFEPPDGPAFFGPVISQVPETDQEVLRLWDALTTLAHNPDFAELKRTIRRIPQVPLLTGGD